MLLDTMPRIPKTGYGPKGGGGLGKGREGSVLLDFELDWVVVNGTVGFPLRELAVTCTLSD